MRIPPTDFAAALGLTLAGQVEVWAPELMVGTRSVDGSRPLLSLTAFAATASIAFRRPAPLAVCVTVAAAMAVQGVFTTPTEGLTGVLALVLAAYAGAAYAPSVRAAAGLAALLAGVATLASDPADWSFGALLALSAGAAGLAVRRRSAAVRAAELERDAAALTERTRIARELHDIVAHRVTTMVVQAQAAGALVGHDEDGARRALAAIDDAGRAALGELRDLLGVLRDDGGDPPRAPQPGLDDLARLVEDAGAAGLAVHLRVEGEPRPVEAGLGLAAYRITQEALTNVVKHAGGAPTDVLLRFADDELEVQVADAGPGGSPRPGGNGLVGMHERASLYGGTVEAGPGERGGFVVRARLPVRDR